MRYSHRYARSILSILLIFLLYASTAHGFIPDRRGSQYNDQLAYIFLPVPAFVGGLGGGLALIAYAGNIYKEIDLIAVGTIGDITSYNFAVNEVDLLGYHLRLGALYAAAPELATAAYLNRGTSKDNNKEDKVKYTVKDINNSYIRLSSEWWDKRLIFRYTHQQSAATPLSIEDKDQNKLADFNNGKKFSSESGQASIILDLTDSYADPYRGVRLQLDEIANSVRTFASTVYIPLPAEPHNLSIHTVYSTSLVKEGKKTKDEFISENGFDCSTAANPTQCNLFVNTQYDGAKFGNARSLGGRSLLRGYPNERFTGRYMKFLGVEYRYNFSTLNKLIDWYVIRDLRTALQFAAFTEVGSTADSFEELHKEANYRQSTGIGFRMVGIGFVYRIDLAVGDEGMNPNIIVQYPW